MIDRIRNLTASLGVGAALSFSLIFGAQPGLGFEQVQFLSNQQAHYQWTSHGPSDGVAQNSWGSVTFADGNFVAVSTTGNNRVMTSVDGALWTPQTAPAQQWSAVTSGLVGGVNRYVAVSMDGPVMTSDDGFNWTLRDAPSSRWWSVTHGNGLFVAINDSDAGDHAIMTSPDGIVWTARTPPTSDGLAWSSVTYGLGSDGVGRFVAVRSLSAAGVPRVMHSSDGVSWSYGVGAPANGWYSVTHGVGSDGVKRFVAVGFSGTDRIMTSTDGINWSVVTDAASKSLGASDFWYAVGFGGGKFVAATFGSDKVMTSNDGLSWTSGTAFAGVWRSVAYGNNTFVIVADEGAGPRVERFGPVVPTAPTQLSAEPAINSATISFSPGLANGAAITNYEYSIDGGVTYIALNPTDSSSPITISGLTQGTSYTVYLRAVNSFGPGEPSAPITFTTLTPLPAQTPSTPDLASSSDTGGSDTDNITSDNTPTISVSGTLDGHTVTVTATKAGESDVSCTFEATAETSCDLGVLADGVWSVTSVQQEPGGLVSEQSPALLITVDTLIPAESSLQVDSSGLSLTLTFGELLDETKLDPAGFIVTIDGNAVSPQQITINGSTIVLQLAEAAEIGKPIVVSYTLGALSDSSLALVDLAGNQVSDFSLSGSRPAPAPVQDQGQNVVQSPPLQAPAAPVIDPDQASTESPPSIVEPEETSPVPAESGAEDAVDSSVPSLSNSDTSDSETSLAETGFSSHQVFAWAVVLMLLGTALMWQSRRHKT